MTDDWNSERMVPERGPVPGRSPLSAAERRQRNLIIGLSIGAVIVLLAGMIAFVATRDSGTPATAPSTVPATTPDSVIASSSSTTSTTTSTTVAETTPPPTTVPIVANADGGADLAVDRGGEFTLVAADLAAGTPNAAVRWTQIDGPDATAGIGSLRGAQAVAIAPNEVATLTFMLEVAGTDGVATDEVIVRVFEDADRAVFVDGERGSDGGDGSMQAPYQSIGAAASAAVGSDLYVRSVGTYDESAAMIELGAEMSLYGGFDENWNRDPDQRAVVDGAVRAIDVSGGGERWIASIGLTAADAEGVAPSIGIRIFGGEIVHIEDSRVVAGRGGDSAENLSGAQSIGISALDVDELSIERSTVNGGAGADGRVAPGSTRESIAPVDGRDGSDRTGGGGTAGGDGGQGGMTSNGASGGNGEARGGAGGTGSSNDGAPGDGGAGGSGGVGGDGGDGLEAADNPESDPVGAIGSPGEPGLVGRAGGGGGGGFGPLLVAGGGGGGSGSGGTPGSAGFGGGGGGGSIGLFAVGVDRIVIVESFVAGGRGGSGAAGGAGSTGQVGGSGGNGAPGVDGLLADGGDGGGGGAGGSGGGGGAGGGGAGGPSYGMLTTRVAEVVIDSSRVRGGVGGAGGDGGFSGVDGPAGSNGSGRIGGEPSTSDDTVGDGQGAGASGGSSYGWFDDSGAVQALNDASFEQGTAGRGGDGGTRGDDGLVVTSNV